MTANPLRAARGTTATLTTRVLKDGELAYNTTTDELHVGDGVTLGGRPISNDDDGDDIEVTATGSVTSRTLSEWFAGMSRGDVETIPAHTIFWDDVNSGTAGSLRLRRRMFLGQAVDTNDNRITGNVQTDWGGSALYANWMPRDSDFVVMAMKGSLAISGLARTSDKAGISPTPSTWGLGGYVLNDASGAFARAVYLEGQRESGAGGTVGAEVVIKNKGTDLTSTPYSEQNSAKGAWLVAGGDPSYGGTPSAPPDTALIVKNGGATTANYRWNKGVVFNATALTGTDGSDGDTGSGVALELAKQHRIQWLKPNGNVGGFIKSITTNAGRGGGIRFEDNFVAFTDASGNIIGRADNVASPADYVALQAAASGGTVRITTGGATADKHIDLAGRGTGHATVDGKSPLRLQAWAGTATTHTGDTNETILKTASIAANALGANGVMHIYASGTITSSANNKTIRVRLGGIGGTVLGNALVYSINTSWVLELVVQARNATNDQRAYGWTNRNTDGVMTRVGPASSAVDMTAAQDIVLTGQLASSGESISVDCFALTITKEDG